MRMFAKYLVLAWFIPIAGTLVPILITPLAGKDSGDFPTTRFVPTNIWTIEKKGRRRSNYFEFRLQDARGVEYYFRDPDPEPVSELDARFPRNTDVVVIYQPMFDGNAILSLRTVDPSQNTEILSFESTMAAYRSKRLVIFSVMGAWFVIANGIALALLWHQKNQRDKSDLEPEQTY